MHVKDKIIKFYRENDQLLNKGGVFSAEGHLTHRLEDNPIKNKDAICVNLNPGWGDTLSLLHLPKLFAKNPDMLPKPNPVKSGPESSPPRGERIF